MSGGPRTPSPAVREARFAARWEAGWWRGRVLRTERGDLYTVIYQGRRGGGAGPDFRDAVLARPDGTRVSGDVELHLRAGDWRAHGHDTDRRYAGVVLHVVFTPLPFLAPPETPLPLGGAAPIAVLSRDPPAGVAPPAFGSWPCAQLASRLGSERLRALLLACGRARYARREAGFLREIALAEATPRDFAALTWTARDRMLFAQIAEALGYGRDREALRRAGAALASESGLDVAGTGDDLDAIGRARVRGLMELRTRWQPDGPWRRISERIQCGPPRAAARALAHELSAGAGRISPGRARIVAANVVLPFASAAATLDGSAVLAARALAVYEALPGLPSNAITRLLARQFGLARLPTGAAAQQGLHHVWAEWCREKRCASCPCAVVAATAVPVVSRGAAKPDTLLERVRPAHAAGEQTKPPQLRAASGVEYGGDA